MASRSQREIGRGGMDEREQSRVIVEVLGDASQHQQQEKLG